MKEFAQQTLELNISDNSNFKTPLIIDLKSSNKKIRKSVFDKLYNLGYKWNNGYLSMDVRFRNKFWYNKYNNYISDRRYIIIGPIDKLEKNQIRHFNNINKFSLLKIIDANTFLNNYH